MPRRRRELFAANSSRLLLKCRLRDLAMSTRSRARAQRRKTSRQLTLESLEDRRVMTASALNNFSLENLDEALPDRIGTVSTTLTPDSSSVAGLLRITAPADAIDFGDFEIDATGITLSPGDPSE